MTEGQRVYGSRRRGGAHGDVATSPEVVRLMLDLSGYVPERDLSAVRVLEPSCGCGAFMVELARRLVASASRYGFDAAAAFRLNVVGYDIDPAKVAECREAVGVVLGCDVGVSVRLGDYLSCGTERFDLVVGNPPYVRYDNIPSHLREGYRKAFGTFRGRVDLYVAFFEKTLRSLSEGGRHCFLCPDFWMKNSYGRLLRSLVSRDYRLERVVLFSESDRAFVRRVGTSPAVTLISHNPPSGTFSLSSFRQLVDEGEGKGSSVVPSPDGDDWSCVFGVPEGGGSALLSLSDMGFTVCNGVATGAESVFTGPFVSGEVEEELLLPFVGVKDVSGERFCWQGRRFLNPYGRDGALVDLRAYPKASVYLESHSGRLRSRYVASKNPGQWYRTIDRASAELARTPKILVPHVCSCRVFHVDEGRFIPANTLCYIIGGSVAELRLLSAVLMSSRVRDQLRRLSLSFTGGYVRWECQYIRKVRLPDIRRMEDSRREALLGAYDRRDYAGIDCVVDRLFDRA